LVDGDRSGAAGSETILVVDDEDVIRQMVAIVLDAEGYSVLEAASPAEALRVCDEFDGAIDLLITDVVMPGMNGAEVARRIAATRPGIAVLYLSGYTQGTLGNHGVSDPEIHHLQKPFDGPELADAVREVLDLRAGAPPDT